jgi:hypothetical protein
MFILLASPLDLAKEANEWRTGLSVAGRTISILLNEIFREDLRYAIEVNRSVRAHEATTSLLQKSGRLDQEGQAILAQFPYRAPKYRAVTLHVIEPEKPFLDTFEFSKEKLHNAYARGREAAQRPVPEDVLYERLRTPGAKPDR